MEKIEVGDIVYFKTGNIPMTVLRITPQRNGEPDLVYLVFTEDKTQITNDFYITTLTKIKPN